MMKNRGMSSQTRTKTKEVSVQNTAKCVSTAKMIRQMMGRATKSVTIPEKRTV
ncbi:hypothetical protein [Candidatus Brocadia sp. AMX2]|uniref:hypothetical protein n=1 Tax=Candidatus Brocadia sp. AMX2 TaxID=2293635 RepID=UPI0025555625|nr:hypothetical protein [Candidatus Brocadia sp. AMX2]